MNRNLAYALVVVAATAAAAATPAFAETTAEYTQPFVSVKSRADVQAELAAYQANGVNTYSIKYNPLNTFKSATTREQVVAEYLADRDQVAAFNGEDSGSAYLLAHATKRGVTATNLAAAK